MTAEQLEEAILARLAVGRASLADIQRAVKESGRTSGGNPSFIKLFAILLRLERAHKIKWIERGNVWGLKR